eukprot:987138-Rhodomonas_salina.2
MHHGTKSYLTRWHQRLLRPHVHANRTLRAGMRCILAGIDCAGAADGLGGVRTWRGHGVRSLRRARDARRGRSSGAVASRQSSRGAENRHAAG